MNGLEPQSRAAGISGALDAAEARCAAAGQRLTPTRRMVLEILLGERRAMGAYDILGRMVAGGRRFQPPVVYRALGFLVGQGLAHRIEWANAYVACACPDRAGAHRPAFLVCRVCRGVTECDALSAGLRLGPEPGAVGFAVERLVVEAEGLCAGCGSGGGRWAVS